MKDKDCKPFKHKLGYVTDREDYVECKKCFRHWKLMPNEFKLSKSKAKEQIEKIKEILK